MEVEQLLERMSRWGTAPAFIDHDTQTTYDQLLSAIAEWREQLRRTGVGRGSVVAVEGPLSSTLCALLFAAFTCRAIVALLLPTTAARRARDLEVAEAQFVLSVDVRALCDVSQRAAAVSHPLLARLKALDAPGLLIFTQSPHVHAGHTAVLHNASVLLDRFADLRPARRTLAFLPPHRLGGLNTLFYTLANGGVLVTAPGHAPDAVCRTIELHRVALLPASSDFLTQLLASEAHRRFDLTSLELITYGKEPMPESTLRGVHHALPRARLLQTYGRPEFGVLRTRSRAPDSPWMTVGGDGVETKVVDGSLWVKARSAMLGYLNAPSPFDAQGWMDTGEAVEVDEGFIRIVGRAHGASRTHGESIAGTVGQPEK